MANEKSGGRKRPERFEPGASYDEVGPELGQLRDAWSVDTGRPVLEFDPGDGVEWEPSGDYELHVSCRRSSVPGRIRLWLDEAPAQVQTDELADIFMWVKAFLERVEKNPRVSTHLTPSPLPVPATAARRRFASALLALATGLVWLHLERPTSNEGPSDDAQDAPFVTDTKPLGLAYPMPAKPFRNQAAAPCDLSLLEEEINGGCWLALDKRPPCIKIHAEYQGKCYVPVAKDRGRLPTSVEP